MIREPLSSHLILLWLVVVIRPMFENVGITLNIYIFFFINGNRLA